MNKYNQQLQHAFDLALSGENCAVYCPDLSSCSKARSILTGLIAGKKTTRATKDSIEFADGGRIEFIIGTDAICGFEGYLIDL